MKTLLWIRASSCELEELRAIDKIAEYRIITVDVSALDANGLPEICPDVVLIAGPGSEIRFEETLAAIQKHFPLVPIITYEPDGSVRTGAKLIARGAFYHFSQRVGMDVLLETIRTAYEHRSAPAHVPQSQRAEWQTLLVGASAAIRETTEIIRLVSDRRSTVLITGETGTGKELAARAIHLASNRATRPMVAVNCAALPENLLETELFGHTKGAFTGAINARSGLFEKADGSTIFLDEIGEMPLALQSKLLRVLQEREFQRIGSSDPVRVNVRVIAASNIDLLQAVAQRRFREDLYYRLNVVPLRIAPLRERLSDIPSLVDHFLDKIAEQEMRPRKQAAADVIDLLSQYAWPGNVRQLEHAIEAATILSGERMILRPSDFHLAHTAAQAGPLPAIDLPNSGLNFEELISTIERHLLERALLQANGNKARAADLLGMKRTTLISKSKALQVYA